MKAACSGAEIYVSFFFIGGAAIPQAGTAVDALLAIECRYAIFATRDGLSGTHFDTEFRFAILAELGTGEDNVIGVGRWGLDTAAHQKGILVRDQ